MSDAAAKAIRRATAQLKANHQAEFNALIDVERRGLGLPPIHEPVPVYWILAGSTREARGYVKRYVRRGIGARRAEAQAHVIIDYLSIRQGRWTPVNAELVLAGNWRKRTDLAHVFGELRHETNLELEALVKWGTENDARLRAAVAPRCVP